MKLILEKEEALAIIHSALCNGGLTELRSSSVGLKITHDEYDSAKEELLKTMSSREICREDVWVQILREGKTLGFYDYDGEEVLGFTLDKAIEEMSKEEVLDIVNTFNKEQDDAFTGWELLQYCLYGEVIFG